MSTDDHVTASDLGDLLGISARAVSKLGRAALRFAPGLAAGSYGRAWRAIAPICGARRGAWAGLRRLRLLRRSADAWRARRLTWSRCGLRVNAANCSTLARSSGSGRTCCAWCFRVTCASEPGWRAVSHLTPGDVAAIESEMRGVLTELGEDAHGRPP